MAEQYLPNYANNILGAFQQGQDRGKQSKLAQLLGTAVNDPAQRQGALGQAAMIDPGAAMSTRSKLNDESLADLSRDADMFLSLPDDQKAVAYPQLAQKAQAVFGHPLPTQYDPKYAPMIQKLAQSGGGATGPGVQSTYIDEKGNRVAILRDGSTQILGRNAPNNQIIDTGNGYVGVNKGNLQAAPVTLGGQPQQAPQQQAPAPQVTDGIDMTMLPGQQVDPRDEVAMIAAAQNPGTQYMPQANGGAAPMAPPQQLRSVPKAPSQAEQQRLVLAQEANQRAAEASQRADEAARNAQRGSAPAGYRFKPDGSLEQIPGAPVSPQMAAQQVRQEKANAAKADTLDTMDQSISAIDDVLKSPGFNMLGTYTGDVVGMLPHTDTANANAALDVVKNQVLLNTISKLKALSATGASGFGSLSNQEGEILKNSIASLKNAQSNGAIKTSLLRIQAALKRSRQRVAGQEVSFADMPQGAPQASGGHVDDLLSKYGVK